MIYDVKSFNEVHKGKKIHCDGKDITCKCYRVDTSGMAWCYKQNKQGKFYLKDGEPAKETIVGKIEIK